MDDHIIFLGLVNMYKRD